MTSEPAGGFSSFPPSLSQRLFDCSVLRSAILDRLADRAFAEQVFATWRTWTPRELARKLNPCLEELKQTFSSQKPFGDSLRFVQVDWPSTGDDMVGWAQAVIAGPEAWATSAAVPAKYQRRAVVAGLKRAFPALEKNPSADQMLTDMILPFRFLVQCHLTAFAIDEAVKAWADGSYVATSDGRRLTAADGASDGSSPQQQRTVPPSGTGVAAVRRPLSAAERHALSHCTGGEDAVRLINALRDAADAAGLRALLQRCRKAGHVTRYIEYQLLFLDLDADTTSDAEFASKLRPLADGGLAFAQHDLGVLLLKLASGAPSDSPQASGSARVSRGATPRPAATPTTPPHDGDAAKFGQSEAASAAKESAQTTPTSKLPAGGGGAGGVSPGASQHSTPRNSIAFTGSSSSLALLSPIDPTTRTAPAPYCVQWVRRGVARGGATMNAGEVEALSYLDRASALGHNEARVAVGEFHVGRGTSIARQAVAKNKDLLALTMPVAPPLPAGRRRPGATTPSPNGSGAGPSVPAWQAAAKFHLKAVSKAVEDLADGVNTVAWERDTHEEDVGRAKELMAEAGRLKQLIRIASGAAAETDTLAPWLKQALQDNSWWSFVFKTWRLVAVAAMLGAVYMAYVLYTSEPSQCSAGYTAGPTVGANAAARRRGKRVELHDPDAGGAMRHPN